MASTAQGIANTGGLLISLNSSSPGNAIVGHLNKLLTNVHYRDIFLFNYKKDLIPLLSDDSWQPEMSKILKT